MVKKTIIIEQIHLALRFFKASEKPKNEIDYRTALIY